MKFFIILVFSSVAIHLASGDAKSAAAKVQAGITAGTKILELFNSNSTTKFVSALGKFSKGIGPFLGALGPLLSLVTLFLPSTPSKEMQKMTKEFAKIDANFDHVFNQFGEVKNLIMKTSLQSQYSQYEHHVLYLSNLLNELMNASPETVDKKKLEFATEAGRQPTKALTTLYRYMMTQSHLSHNIPQTAMQYTDYNRKKVQTLMKGMLNLITQGVKIRLAYLKVKGRGWESNLRDSKTKWEAKLEKLVQHIKDVDNIVKGRWKTQHKIDSLKVAVDKRGKSNGEVAQAIYDMLKEKYDWRKWMVVVYDAAPTSAEEEKHWVNTCYGFLKYEYHGKNIAVGTHTDQFSPLDTNRASRIMKNIKTIGYPPSWLHTDILKASRSFDLGAKKVFYNLRKYIRSSYCAGVIRSDLNPEYRGDPGRFAHVKNGAYKIHIFS